MLSKNEMTPMVLVINCFAAPLTFSLPCICGRARAFSPIIDLLDKLFIENEEKKQSPTPRPVIMFAGEATSAYHPSTLHGDLSGIREAHRPTLQFHLSHSLLRFSPRIFEFGGGELRVLLRHFFGQHGQSKRF